MKALQLIIIHLLLIIAYVSCRVIVIRKGNTHLWNEYKSFFNKDYPDHEEEIRKSIWESILSVLFHHNVRFHLGNESYHVGLNEFSDMEHEDFQKQVTGLVSEINCNNKSMIYKPPATAYIPDYLNWYERGYVTEVLNQGKCGACWAFCSVASLEGQHKRMTGKLVKLSEQNLIDCSHSAGNKGCEGGQMCRAFEYATDAGGVDTEESYPFAKETGTCKFSPSNVGSKVGGYLEIPYGDEDALLKALVLIGPIAAGVDGSQQTFRHYKGGIYDDENCNNKTLNHAVTIIGYGTEAGKDYWLVKNSWGKSWGENGFGKLVRNKNNQCGLASKALFPVLYQDDEGTPLLNGPKALTVN